ncbi:glycosyltransferase family 9 protein [Kangiella sp. HZ709]|uniref:glycosyltransferase family 9 protein n=1 Tax=Kangiella sp. HZ709 TaxID=2666328 RepID=UPI0012AF42DE|nr:glycosyltransferase family 9 protein [Kangiella sp. HZ709]MRX28190.1 ADP-heptose--LPS heptosyltransferase I [Kangiella sp. HZ709]
MNLIDLNANPSICILRLSAIGDVCHAVSTVQAIQRHYPKASITWIIGKIEYQLLQNLPGINFIIFDKAKGRRAYSELKHNLAQTKFDILLQMQLAFRANLAAFFIPAKIKLGFSKQRSKELHSLFVNRHIEQEKGFHVLDGFRDFARVIGVPDSEPSWDIPFGHSLMDWADKELPTSPYIVISPAASKAERDWLVERYAAIADYCHEKNLKVIITGSPSHREQTLAHKIVEATQTKVINLVGKTNLQQLLITLKQAQLVIAPDSGPAHMAVTQGTKVIGLYAHSNPKRTGPYLYQNLVADAYTTQASKQLNLTADSLDWGLRLKGNTLMHAISVEQVKALIDSALAS